MKSIFFHQKQYLLSSTPFYLQNTNLCLTPKKSLTYDSDHDTNDTVSQTSSTSNKKLRNQTNLKEIEQIFDLIVKIYNSVKPKRKIFITPQDKEKYISEYKKKWKTELCKNYLLKGYCSYGATCCFAHGAQELITKTEFNESYKTKPCKKYFLNGYCPYGYRCQYLHDDIKDCPQYYNFLFNLYKQKNMIIDTRLPNLFMNQLGYLEDKQDLLPVSSRLSIFGALEKKI